MAKRNDRLQVTLTNEKGRELALRGNKFIHIYAYRGKKLAFTDSIVIHNKQNPGKTPIIQMPKCFGDPEPQCIRTCALEPACANQWLFIHQAIMDS